MLVAYLDEFGHVGPFISPDHPRFKTHPVFGYGGYVIPASKIRKFGSIFEGVKDRHFKHEIQRAGAHPRRWEKKGAELLTEGSWTKNHRQIRRKFRHLSTELKALGGEFFYYGELKPKGTERATQQSSGERSASMLVQCMRDLSYIASEAKQDMFIFLDQVDTRNRDHAISNMAGFLYSKDSPNSVKRIVEVPMQLESRRYGAMQFADWFCALISRTTYTRFIQTEKFSWAPDLFALAAMESGQTTLKSRIWIPERAKPIWTHQLADSDWEIYTEPKPQ